jgi:hypothetical protein
MESVEQALMERFLSLAMGKFCIKEAAVGFGDSKGVEFSFILSIGEVPKVTPIDLHLLRWGRFKTDKGFSVFDLTPCILEILPDNGDSSIEAMALKALENYRCFYQGILIEKLIDQIPEGVQFGGFG